MTAALTVPLGTVCRLVNGRAFKPSEWSHAGLPIVRIQNLNDRRRPFNRYSGKVDPKLRINSGDVLLSWSGTPGTSFGCFIWDRGPAIVNQHIFRVYIDADRIDREFFVHAVNSRLAEMIGLAHGGVGLRHITKDKLEAIHLPLPAIVEQRRIVAHINACMDRVSEIQRLRGESLKAAASLLPAHLNDVRNGRQWPEVALGRVLLETRNGRSIPADGVSGDGSVLTLSAVRRARLDVTARKTVALPESVASAYQVRLGDLFVSRSNTRELVGLSAIVEDEPPSRMIYPDLLIRLTANTEQILARYLVYALRFPDTRRQIQERATGSSQSMVKISAQRLREVLISLPSKEEQAHVVERIQAVSDATCAVQEAILQPEVQHLRSAVLNKVLPGEL